MKLIGRINLFRSLLLVSVLAAPVQAAEPFLEGQDYIEYRGGESRQDAVSVNEFFKFGCGYCAEFHRQVQSWLQGKEKTLRYQRAPVMLSKRDKEMAKAYYAAEGLKLEDVLWRKVTSQADKGSVQTMNEEVFVEYLAGTGLDERKLRMAYGSFTAEARAAAAVRLSEHEMLRTKSYTFEVTKKYLMNSAKLTQKNDPIVKEILDHGIQVPVIVIGGRYKVVAHKLEYDYRKLHDLLDFLVAKSMR